MVFCAFAAFAPVADDVDAYVTTDQTATELADGAIVAPSATSANYYVPAGATVNYTYAADKTINFYLANGASVSIIGVAVTNTVNYYVATGYADGKAKVITGSNMIFTPAAKNMTLTAALDDAKGPSFTSETTDTGLVLATSPVQKIVTATNITGSAVKVFYAPYVYTGDVPLDYTTENLDGYKTLNVPTNDADHKYTMNVVTALGTYKLNNMVVAYVERKVSTTSDRGRFRPDFLMDLNADPRFRPDSLL